MIEIEEIFWLQTIRLRQQLLLKSGTRLFKFGPGTHGSSTNKGYCYKRDFK
jgi:hypothetical protein